MTVLRNGQKVPAVGGALTTGERFEFSRPLGGPLVVFFYPKAFTPNCTKEVCGFRDAHPDLVALGATVVGVSRDSPSQNLRFKETYQLPFELVSDESGEVARAFGVQLFGGLLPRCQRATFIVDKNGVVRGSIKDMFDALLHVAEAKAAVQELVGG